MSKPKAKKSEPSDWIREPLSNEEIAQTLRMMRLSMALSVCGVTDTSTSVPIKLLLRLMVQAGIPVERLR